MSNLNIWKRPVRGIVPQYVGSGFNSLVDEFFSDFMSPVGQDFKKEFTPNINLSETEEEYKVVAELPGLEEKDFDITIEENVLRLKGEKRNEIKESKEHFHRVETYYGSFERSIRLPDAIQVEGSKATFKNGVLTLVMPKNKELSKIHKLQISKE